MNLVPYLEPFNNKVIYYLCDNTIYLSLLFAGCGLYAESHKNKHISECLKTNIRLSSSFLVIGSLLNMYRVNIL